MHAKRKTGIAALLLLAGWHCAQAQAQTQMPPRPQEDFLHAPDRVQWDAGALYEGRFEDGAAFQIELAYPLPRSMPASIPPSASPRFSQTVRSMRDDAGMPSALLAAGGAGLQLRLAVANADGAPGAEIYSITLTPDYAGGRGVLTGPDAAGQRSFTLVRSVRYTGVVVTRPASPELAAYSTYYREHGFVFSAFFPTLGEPAADDWIRERAGSCDDSGECANTVRILWRSRALVSLYALNWGDSGGAHGIGHSSTQSYRIQGSAATPLGLDAFLDQGAACRQQVSAAIVAGLRAKHMSWAEKIGLDAARAARFTPAPGGIAFHFDSYEAGPYAEGAPTVFVSSSEMAGCVKNLPAAD